MNKHLNFKSFRHVIIVTFAIVMVMMLLALSVQAAGKTIEISDLGIQCTIPDYFTYVLTRDNIKSDADVSSLGLTKDQILNMFTESNIYLEAGTEYFETDFRITMAPSTTGDFSVYGDTLLNSMGNVLVKNLQDYGYRNIVCEVYHHKDTVFLKLEYSLPSGSDYSCSIQYYTVMNAQAINFTISFMSNPTASEKAMVKGIVDSAVFKNAPFKETEDVINNKYPAFDYNDEYVSFHIPMGWSQEPIDSDHEIFNAKFQKVSVPGIMMTYGCQDVWAQLSQEEKKGRNRSEMSFSLWTDKEIRDYIWNDMGDLGADIDSISFEVIGGIKYCQLVMTVNKEIDGIQLSVIVPQMIYLENGYVFSFAFSQEPSGKYYREFKAILESVTYHLFDENDSSISEEITAAPNQSVSPSVPSSPATPSSVMPTETNYLGFIIGGVVVAVLIVVLLVLIIKRTSHKKTQSVKTTQINNDENTTNINDETNQIMFCHKCGSRLTTGETMCKNCGTVIPR